jgi:mannosyltransferase OCH1-like enzyme
MLQIPNCREEYDKARLIRGEKTLKEVKLPNPNLYTETQPETKHEVVVPPAEKSIKQPSSMNKKVIYIVFPYRNREMHYQKIMQHLPTINREEWDLHTILVEQADDEPFNRAWLLNIGIAEVKKRSSADDTCVVTHDIDMIADSKVDYGWCDEPTQICSELSCFGGGVPYAASGGGVVQASLKHWYQINGFTNLAVGWGGEDDDLHHRFRINNLLSDGHLRRPAKGFGKCHCMHDDHHTKRVRDEKGYKNILSKISRMTKGSNEWKTDGLNNLQYRVLEERIDKYKTIHIKVADFETENTGKIPKIIHQIWLGSKERPKSLMDRCRNMHEGWEYKLWTEQNLFALENQNTFDCGRNPTFKSDVLRYEVLKRYGGFYLDADTLCLRPLDPLLNRSFVIGYQHYKNPALKNTFRYNDKFIANGIMGTVKSGRIITKIVSELRNNVEMCKMNAWESVGPTHVGKVLQAINFTDVQPFWAFVPYHWAEKKNMETFEKLHTYRSFALNLWGTTFDSWSNLKDFNWKNFHRQTSDVSVPCHSFRRLMTKDLITKYANMIKVLNGIFEVTNIDYSIIFGTALGYKRHGGFIPWDDDFDIYVRREDSDKILKLIKEPLCTFMWFGGFKVYECESPKAGKYEWGYPFIDVWDGRSPKYSKSISPSIIFPSTPIEMEGMALRGPHNIEKHLELKYDNVDECLSPSWDHKNEVRKKRETYMCKDVMTQCFN